ncbi:CRIB domain [Macleaya cordata]|uniref:CRIB domain n=1 Tax=Macleaya cordata TaxID=56857 RepID=A0A200Q6I9_MACCD|nr:CRIB domain [Macleaya cordata]
MTEVLRSPSHFPSSQSSSSSSSISCVPTSNDGSLQNQSHHHSLINLQPNSSSIPVDENDSGTDFEDGKESRERDEEGDQLSVLALLVTAFRKYLVACRTERKELCSSMEIGWPTNVRHVAHVTFDRFNGFLGLPVEFEPEVPRRAPSASASVFGVSAESMQCSYDSRGNSVPTILLLMQRHLYAQGGLQAEGIFRITAENSQEEYVRDQLNRGVVPNGIDVHCLAGLIKAWFRELPSGILDPLPPEQVMQCQSEEEYTELTKLLPPTEASLLDWAINLMADVVQEEHQNKMNARNVATVFAPNMTQMSDPLTALMYAVQVMNFLKTLIMKVLREREDSLIQSAPASRLEPSGENDHHGSPLPCLEEAATEQNEETEHVFIADEPVLESPPEPTEDNSNPKIDNAAHSFQTSVEKAIHDGKGSLPDNSSCKPPTQADSLTNRSETAISCRKVRFQEKSCRNKTGQSSYSNLRKGPRKANNSQPVVKVAELVEKSRGVSIVSRLNSRTERIEAWR